MKQVVVLSVVSLTLLILVAEEALAHGGGSFRGPGSAVPPGIRTASDPVPPPPPTLTMACDCASPTCRHCADPLLVAGAALKRRATRVRVLSRWGDLARVRIETWFEGASLRRPVEAYQRIGAGTLLAVMSGALYNGGGALDGRLLPSERARRDYLWERFAPRIRDPMLVLPANEGGVHLRVFPVRRGTPSYVVLEGYQLTEPSRKSGLRMYVTKEPGKAPRYLAVLPQALVPATRSADHVDPATDRALLFLDAQEARGLFGLAVDLATHVPCIPALAAAAQGEGDGVVHAGTALLAMPAGRRAPRHVRVLSTSRP